MTVSQGLTRLKELAENVFKRHREKQMYVVTFLFTYINVPPNKQNLLFFATKNDYFCCHFNYRSIYQKINKKIKEKKTSFP